jgi:hypothetical protein
MDIDARIRSNLKALGTGSPLDHVPYFYRIEVGETNLVDSTGNRSALRLPDTFRNGIAATFFESGSLTFEYTQEEDGQVTIAVAGRLGMQFDDEDTEAADVLYGEELTHIVLAFAEDGNSPAHEVNGTLMEGSQISCWEVVEETDDWWHS